jgi:hypothetical protein
LIQAALISASHDRKNMRQAFLKPQYHSVQELRDTGMWV